MHDGLTDEDAERAFDEPFDRLEHLRVTCVVVTVDSGKAGRAGSAEVVTGSDDGCD